MRSYCRALAGGELELRALSALTAKGLGWADLDSATSDGTIIYLPSAVGHFDTEEENFAWYKALATHQCGHIEFRSYDFSFERQGALFESLRPELQPGEIPHENESGAGEGPESGEGPGGDLGRFFRSFEEQALIRDLFSVAEDVRVDSRIFASYPGLAVAYEAARELSLRRRPPLESLPPREALVELLVRASLGKDGEQGAPPGYSEPALQARSLLLALSAPEAKVEDAAEAAVRIYRLLIRVPDTGGEGYRPAATVLYRGAFKPELAQLLLRASAGSEAGRADLARRVERLMRSSLEVELMPGEIPENLKWEAATENMVREILERDPAPRLSMSSRAGEQDRRGPLVADEPDSHLYPEWDCGQGKYRDGWCLVREKSVEPARTGFFQDVLLEHATLARRIRRQFEVIALQMYRKQGWLEDGEDYDLDAVVDAAIDLRTGRQPSDKLFWRRNKNERSVAALFLLDMSASTSEAIGGGPARGKKRLIDVEKEALVLLMNALEILGDGYGVYGFSGYGRDNVEFYPIKDLDEKLTRQVTGRIDGIGPRNATRMGAAIRHATVRLLRYPARFRLLFLLSDGRPQDRGYGSAGESLKYAVEDTRTALQEARQQGVTAFCLTVDREGHDYLKTMMQGMGYEVLWDVTMLPERLAFLYRKLTT